MPKRPPEPISARARQARFVRVQRIASRLGFIGSVEYRHEIGDSGGAQYVPSATVESDRLVVDAEAFRRDAAGDDFTLEAIVAHERGHQLVCRHEQLQRNLPKRMSLLTEEVLASLVGALIAQQPRDGQMLVLKALSELIDHGMQPTEASRRVESVLGFLEEFL